MNQIYAFMPTLKVFQIFGINPFAVNKNFQPEESRNWKIYSIFCIAFSILPLSASWYDGKLYLAEDKSDRGFIVDFIQLLGVRLTHLIIVFEAFYQQKLLLEYFVKLYELDMIIETDIGGVKIERNRGKHLRMLMTAALFYVGVLLVSLVFLMKRDLTIYIYAISYLLSYLISCFRYLQYFHCVWFIRQRLIILNAKFSEIEIDNKNIERKVKNLKFIKSVDVLLYKNDLKSQKYKKNFELLILMRKMYNKVYILSTLVNYSFGFSLLSNIANDFFSLTANSYFICLSMINSSELIEKIFNGVRSFLWCSPHLLNLILASIVCHLTIRTVSNQKICKEINSNKKNSLKQSNKTGLILHKLKVDYNNEIQTLFIEQFSLQLLHQKIQFNAFGFFNLDLSLLYTIVAAITTYLVILIQFYISGRDSS
ncbi:CLUMA_CG015588, isoform A [Clunio marinus]|uniref:Gustatory receptor n=1 Tax=Clunio marinus TaxID=568069 RepID=A0A1J1IPC9_9DIPT|nr:CLUMA_CG015588, isoform A [Clunio marinus]